MKHTVEFDEKCTSCGGTGLYVGMGEHDGAAVVCHGCDGTGKYHFKHEYEDFDGRLEGENIERVYATNVGIGIGKAKGKYVLTDFGGMNYQDWLEGKPFPKQSEMRRFVCPAWWYQSADYKKKPTWKECGYGSFNNCAEFSSKDKCWERWDREFHERV